MSGETSDKTNDEIKVLLKMYPYKEDGTIKIGNIKLQYENLNGSVSINDQVDFYLRDLAKWLHWYANSNGSDTPEYLTTVVPSSTIRYVQPNRSDSSSNDDNNNKLGGNTKYTKCLKKKSKKKREKTSKKKREKTSKKR